MQRLLPFTHFIVLRSFGLDDAAVRLQSEPILNGLRADPGRSVTVVEPDWDTMLVLDRDTCVLFHYADVPAISALKKMRTEAFDVLVVCLACDIYSYTPYVELHQRVDLFIAPTDLHRSILASQLYKPVYTLREGVDPIAFGKLGQDRGARRFPSKTSKRVLWFGYSESFMKSMTSLLPVIRKALREGAIDDFTLILDRENFIRRYGGTMGFDVIDYDSDTFAEYARQFDYAVLSHFALDLAVNSYIKSANKAVTSLVAGVMPLCSDTPNYRSTLSHYGLDRFLFGSPLELDRLLRSLEPASDSAAVANSAASENLCQEGSEDAIYKLFLAVLVLYASVPPDELRHEQPPSFIHREVPPTPLRFREHLNDLLPSVSRAFKSRLAARRAAQD